MSGTYKGGSMTTLIAAPFVVVICVIGSVAKRTPPRLLWLFVAGIATLDFMTELFKRI